MPEDARPEELQSHRQQLLELISRKGPSNDPEALGMAEVCVADLATNAIKGSDMQRLKSQLIAELGEWFGGRCTATRPDDVLSAGQRLSDKVDALYEAALERR